MKTYPRHYFRWRNIKNRCYRGADKSYAYYGGRGICVCDEWLDFKAFAAWCDAQSWVNQDIDRVDPDGNYSPDNCRMVSREVNQRNQRRAKNITWQGQTKHYIDWAKQLGLSPDTLRSRVFRNHWPLDRAMTEGTSNE
jgi:hypothetical protein